MSKKILSLILAATLLLSACGQKPAASTPEAASSPASAATESKGKYAIVLGGSLGDLGFNDEGYAGMKMAADEYGVEIAYSEPKGPTDIEPQMRMYAEAGDCDLIFGHGATHVDAIKILAEEYPEQRFVLVDGVLEGYDNVSSISAKNPEQTFLSGVIAGLVTVDERMEMANKENVLGFAIGLDSPVARAIAAGFMAGAKYVNPEVEIIHNFVGSYRDPGKGKEIAMTAFGRGADIVSHNAGSSGLGVINAAVEEGKYAIGTSLASVDADHTLVTSLKRIDLMIYNEIKSDVEGNWVKGSKVSGLAEGICNYNIEGLNTKLPQDIIDKVEDIKKQIIDGKLTLPSDITEVEEWAKANQYKTK